MKNSIQVYVENLKKYNQGILNGRWITLGIEEESLQKTLKDHLGIVNHNSAIAIFDYRADFEIDEHENIYHLNQTAKLLNYLLDGDYKKVLDYCKVREITAALEISNVCLQLDEFIYGHFSRFDQNIKDPDEKLGHALFTNSKLAVYMRQNKMESYFDYKAYGRDVSISSYDVGDYGYVYKKDSVDTKKYSYKEIDEMMKNGPIKYIGQCQCINKFIKNFFILSQNEYVKIQKVCKNLDMLFVVEFTMSGYDHLYALVVDHISRVIHLSDLTVGKNLREFKAGDSIEEERFNDILDELNNPKIYRILSEDLDQI